MCESPELACYGTECGAREAEPDCSGRECGDDGFGGSCGTCAMGRVCGFGGECVPEPDEGIFSPTGESTFAAIYSEILIQQGCDSKACHSTTGFVLEAQDTAYFSLLLGVSSFDQDCAGKRFIVPGNVDESYLYQKLLPDPSCGDLMPLSEPLSEQQMAQIRTWIELGARNN